MESGRALRGFRMDREKEKDKNQTSMLRYVRTMTPRTIIGSTSEPLQNSADSTTTTPDSAGSSSSPNPLDNQPSLLQGSKLFYVTPSDEGNVNDAKDCGFDMTPLLKSQNSMNGNHSEDSNHTDNSSDLNQDNGVSSGNHVNKRLRIESDDDENCSGRVVKRPCLSDDESDDNQSSITTKITTTKFSPEMIEKLLDTYNDLYPTIDRMELFETMEKWDYNFSEMTKRLDTIVKEQKMKEKQKNKSLGLEQKKKKIMEGRLANLEEKRRARMEDRERIKKQKQAEMRKKKIIWKMKARFHEEQDDEEEEDYIGKTKVYESDSSEGEGAPDDDEEVVTPARNMVMEFFNECPPSELSTLPSCSKKKADVILGLRPFESWRDLVYKFKTGRYISTDLLNNAKDVLQMRSAIKNLMKRCEKISSEIQTFVTEIISDDGTSGMSEQPKILCPEMTLKHYQLIGLNWLVLMHDQQLNGVLADEMGLGKTIQAISFLGYLKERGELEDRMCLIVVPTSTLDNWARELTTWLPSVGFLTYHGSQEERKGMRMDILNDELDDDVGIILTTYNMVTSSPEDKALFKRLALHTIVYDEAHMLKNMTSQRYENLIKIRCLRRVLLTGTPLQNNLVELMSILIFVMPQLFEGRKEELKKVFSMFPKNESNDNKGRYEMERILQAKRIMAPFFLRRLKEDVLKDLPKKTDEVFHVAMNERQEKMYTTTIQALSKRAEELKEELEKMKLKDLEEMEELQMNAASSSGKGTGKKLQTCEDSSSNMLMKLRKLANHPLLLRNLYNDNKIKEMAQILKKSTHKESILDYIIEDFSVMSDFEIHQTCMTLTPITKYKLEPNVIVQSGKMERLDEMLPKMKKDGDRVLIFSQFVIVLNLLEEYMKIRGYVYRRLDGSTLVAERQEMIDDFNEDENIFIFLLSTRAGGLGINLSSANTVILHDIDFNPYNDKQAEDRCHRVGQTRDVKVYRFITKDSIEQGMFQIACNKLQLEKDVTGVNEEHRKSDVVALLKTALRVNNPDSE